MSTLKTVNVQHPSASTPAITLDSAGAMTGSFPYPNRNLLYNGAMQVAQRGTSASGLTGYGYNTADRWVTSIQTCGTWTQSVENDAPTGSGFRKSLKMLCTTADAAPAAADLVVIAQFLEGQDLQRIAKGTASAQQLTLSFWVKSNVTGTYVAELIDSDNNRQVSGSYTVSASGTWEKKSITYPADTTGALNNDNGLSMYPQFYLAAGSNFTSSPLQTSWGTSSSTVATGQVNVAAATNNYWQITGVQLETGSVATQFEFKSFGQELRECQRYYETGWQTIGYFNTSALAGYLMGAVQYSVAKRAAATVSTKTFYNNGTQAITPTWQTISYRNGTWGTTAYYTYTSGTFLSDIEWVASAEL